MRAFALDAFGAAPALTDLPAPTITAQAVAARHPKGITGLIDLASQDAETFTGLTALLADGARAATTLGVADPAVLAERGITATNIFATPDAALLARVAQHAEQGVLVPRIERTFRLEEIGEALTTISEGHVRGKLAVTFA
ncbi:zinc-binding dehydrogenase [Kitasatospora sp. NPDC097643]|uniref:zinc-binding dehydrogenase n=1 Tax=Kitasatospora sp. NPDC097643 TaxID=3157230 RepID=UPI003324C8FE